MNNKIHFIAIGGAVMHNLALALQKEGEKITGSDDEIYDPAKTKLKNAGILPETEGWNEDNITEDLDAVILGMHAKADNPELLKAKKLGLKIYSFPEYIYERSKDKQRIVIAGSHGKTTITSIILHVLKKNNREFDYLVGAQIEGFDLMVKLSDAPIIIIEGDEYLSSALQPIPKFLFYHPHIALISGIAWDHFNVFPTFNDYVKAFDNLIKELPKAGILTYDSTDKKIKDISSDAGEDVTVIPYKPHPYEIEKGKVYLKDNRKRIPIQIFGEHNMKNIMGAKEILLKLGITNEEFYSAISSFSGASKRLEKLGENENTVIFKDFAHSPSKVEATTKATKELYPTRKLIACYELHTYSSLNAEFLPHYKNTLNAADEAVVFYSPQTLKIKKLEPLDSQQIKDAFNNNQIKVFTDPAQLKEYLLDRNWYQTNLLLMSSGTFNGLNFAEVSQEILALPVKEEKQKSSFFKRFKS